MRLMGLIEALRLKKKEKIKTTSIATHRQVSGKSASKG